MASSISVNRESVRERDIVSLSKTYNGEEHEIYIPSEQVPQVVMELLYEMNQSREEDDQFVLVRKSQLGYVNK